MDIGSRIKEKRELCRLSQAELAEKMGYKSKTSIHKIETGITDLPLSKVEEFARVLNTTPGQLMGWKGEGGVEDEESIASVVARFEDINSLLNYFVNKYSLSEGEQQELEKILQFNVLLFKDTDITTAGAKKLKIYLLEVYVEALLGKRKKEGR